MLERGGWEAKAWIDSRAGRSDPIFAEYRDMDADIDAGPVLVLAPHQDDEAIGFGGTICAHIAAGSTVTVLFLTDGSGGKIDPELVNTRRREAESVGDVFGIDQIFWDVEDTKLISNDQLSAELARIINKLAPGRIYLPSFFEKHADHFAANQLAIDAIKQAGREETHLLGYEVWDTAIKPNYFVDITEHFDAKCDMLGHYVTPMSETNYGRLCEARGALHHFLQSFGASEGYAEAFYRADALTYEQHYLAYLEILRGTGNSLVQKARD